MQIWCYVVAWWPAEMLIGSAGRLALWRAQHLITVYIFVCLPINQDEKYRYILYLFTVYIFVCPPINQESAIAHRKLKIGPHAPTMHAQFTNSFRTHFRTHIARADVRFSAHVRRNPTSVCVWHVNPRTCEPRTYANCTLIVRYLCVNCMQIVHCCCMYFAYHAYFEHFLVHCH